MTMMVLLLLQQQAWQRLQVLVVVVVAAAAEAVDVVDGTDIGWKSHCCYLLARGYPYRVRDKPAVLGNASE
jgi:hypothetical protein